MSKFSRIARQVGRIFPFRGEQVEPEDRADYIQLVQGYLGSALWEGMQRVMVTGLADALTTTLIGAGGGVAAVPTDEIWVIVTATLIGTDTASRTYWLRDIGIDNSTANALTIARQAQILASDPFPWWPNPMRYVLGPGHGLQQVASALTAGALHGSRLLYVPLKLGETIEP